MTNDGKCRPHQPVVDYPQFCLQLAAQSPPCCIIHNIPFKTFQYIFSNLLFSEHVTVEFSFITSFSISGFQVTFFSMSSLYLVPLMAAVTWLVKYRLYRRQPRQIYIRNPFPQNRRGRIIVHSKYLLCLDILFFSTSIQSNSKCQPSRQQSCQPSRPPRSTPSSAWWCGGWRIMHPRLAP